mgnify:FL=1
MGAAFIFTCISMYGISCGYALQTSHSGFLEKEGIKKVYVSPVVNNTYKAGVENLVYNSLIRTLGSNRMVRIVQQAEQADALLQGTVNTAQYAISVVRTADRLNPINLGSSDRRVAAEYSVSLNCSFLLVRAPGRAGPQPSMRSTVWSSTFSRNKPIPAANQLDVPGTTSALINESEFDRALQELSQNMMSDVHESMLAAF